MLVSYAFLAADGVSRARALMPGLRIATPVPEICRPMPLLQLDLFCERAGGMRGKICRWVKGTGPEMQKAGCEHPAFFGF
jgi:hypothetical protein